MGTWYSIGAALGFGLGLGVILAGLLAADTKGLVAAAVVAAAVSVAFTFTFGTEEAIAGAVGALVGVAAAAIVVRGALRRGGTRLGVAGYTTAIGLLIVALSAVPALGYLLAIALPALAARVRRKQTERFAGLRTLAK